MNTHANDALAKRNVAILVAAQGTLGVVSVSPAANEISAPTGGFVVVEFDQALAVASVTPDSFEVFGRWSGVHAGTLEVVGSRIGFSPEKPFFPGEQVTVMLTREVRALSGATLSGGYGWQFWTRSSRGSGTFQRVATYEIRLPGEQLVQAYGASAADLDGDGDPDLSIPCEVSSDVRVFENFGCNFFAGPSLHGLPAGSFPSSNDNADFDGDGRTDLVVANINGNSTSVFLGTSAGTYAAQVEQSAGIMPRALAAFDADADGAPDLVSANLGSSDLSYQRNFGNGFFAPGISFEGGGSGEAALASVDANGDGRWDLFVGHRFSQTATSLLGDGNGQFTIRDSTFIGGQSWMLAAGDLDGDGDVDLTSANSAQGNAGLAFNDGTGLWASTQTLNAGGFTIATDLGDLDADGDLDLVLSNFATANWTVYRNNGSGQFTQSPSLFATQAGSCMTVADYDLDGDLDLIGLDEVSDQFLVFEQIDLFLPGLQTGQCASQLRVDNLAGSTGFNGTPPHPALPGATLSFGLSGQPFTTPLLGIGLPAAPGVSLPTGLLNLMAPAILPMAPNSPEGANLLQVVVPAGLPPGLELAVQAFDAGRLTNAEILRIQ